MSKNLRESAKDAGEWARENRESIELVGEHFKAFAMITGWVGKQVATTISTIASLPGVAVAKLFGPESQVALTPEAQARVAADPKLQKVMKDGAPGTNDEKRARYLEILARRAEKESTMFDRWSELNPDDLEAARKAEERAALAAKALERAQAARKKVLGDNGAPTLETVDAEDRADAAKEREKLAEARRQRTEQRARDGSAVANAAQAQQVEGEIRTVVEVHDRRVTARQQTRSKGRVNLSVDGGLPSAGT